MIDLHTHSTASDGTYTPGELIRKAAEEGLVALALTDHDSLDGLEEASAAALSAGIRFVPGVEIEIGFGPGEFHLLGLDLRQVREPLIQAATELAMSRENRNEQVFQLLQTAGMDLNYRELREQVGEGMIGRPHIAKLLVEKRMVKSKQEAFDRYLAKGKPFFVQKACLELPRAIEVIKDSRGLDRKSVV